MTFRYKHQNQQRDLQRKFQDAISELVDRYLKEGLDPELLTGVLWAEAENDLDQLKQDLIRTIGTVADNR